MGLSEQVTRWTGWVGRCRQLRLGWPHQGQLDLLQLGRQVCDAGCDGPQRIFNCLKLGLMLTEKRSLPHQHSFHLIQIC